MVNFFQFILDRNVNVPKRSLCASPRRAATRLRPVSAAVRPGWTAASETPASPATPGPWGCLAMSGCSRLVACPMVVEKMVEREEPLLVSLPHPASAVLVLDPASAERL